MMRTFLASVLAAAATTASAAETPTARLFALQAGETSRCAAPAAGVAKAMTFSDPIDAGTRAALSAGVFLALHDISGAGAWPGPEVADAAPCALARFEANEAVWTISGGQGRAPARWIWTANGPGFFYLARGPALTDALAWSRARQGPPAAAGGSAYYLVAFSAEGDHYVLKIYDGLPDTKQLADEMADLLTGSLRPLAVFDSTGDAVTVLQRTEAGPRAEVFRPAAIKPDRPANLKGPDDHFFSGAPAGAWTLRGSGFSCPPSFGRFERTRAIILNPVDETLDLACGFATDESHVTVFVSRAPDAKADKAYFSGQIADAERGLEKPRRLKDPPAGKAWPIQAGRAWLDKNGLMQELMFMRRGEYLIELRGTYVLEDVEAAGEALIKLIEAVTPTTADR